jgi:hypothetical protein
MQKNSRNTLIGYVMEKTKQVKNFSSLTYGCMVLTSGRFFCNAKSVL